MAFFRFFALLTLVVNFIGCSEVQQQTLLVDHNLPGSEGIATASTIIGGQLPQSAELVSQYTVGIANRATGNLCTGTIIGKRLIFTAAHCVDKPSRIMVLFGHNLKQAQIMIQASKIAVNTGYRQRRPFNVDIGDVALIEIEQDIPPTHQVAKIVPAYYFPYDTDLLTIAGYGVTSGITKKNSGLLRQTKVRVIDGRYGDSEFVVDQTNGSGACYGDSGGPAFLYTKGQLLLIGVASRVGNNGADPCKGVAVYSNAGYYRRFIKDAVQQFAKE